jgi:hypothetical protein
VPGRRALDSKPARARPALNTAIELQRLLNTLETRAKAIAVPAHYNRAQDRVLLAEDSDLESLG